jgi:pimeloyl-ACP methyl ester carboxylesterase
MSARDPDWKNYNPLTEANDVLDGVTAASVAEAAVVGTSRGGMVAMILSALRPAFLKAVVLNDVGPEINARGLVRIRAYVEGSRDFSDWEEATDAVRAIGENSFPNFDDAAWAKQARLIFEEKNGRIVRSYDPDLIKTLTAINLDLPLPTMWPQFDGLKNIPVMVIRGERSDLLSRETVDKMHDVHPGMWSITVPDQGHAPDLGYGDLPERIVQFMDEADERNG